MDKTNVHQRANEILQKLTAAEVVEIFDIDVWEQAQQIMEYDTPELVEDTIEDMMAFINSRKGEEAKELAELNQ